MMLPPHSQKMDNLSGKNPLKFLLLSLRNSDSTALFPLNSPFVQTQPLYLLWAAVMPTPTFSGDSLNTPPLTRCIQSLFFYWLLVLST